MNKKKKINWRHLYTSNGIDVSLPKVLMICSFIMCIVMSLINPVILPSWIGILSIPTISATAKGITYNNGKTKQNIEQLKINKKE